MAGKQVVIGVMGLSFLYNFPPGKPYKVSRFPNFLYTLVLIIWPIYNIPATYILYGDEMLKELEALRKSLSPEGL
jgi:hypothetical protein